MCLILWGTINYYYFTHEWGIRGPSDVFQEGPAYKNKLHGGQMGQGK